MNNHCGPTVHYIRHHRLTAYSSIAPPHPAAVPLLLVHQCLLLPPVFARIPGRYSSSTGSWSLEAFWWSERGGFRTSWMWGQNCRCATSYLLGMWEERCLCLQGLPRIGKPQMYLPVVLAHVPSCQQGIQTLLIRFQVMVSCPSIHCTVTQRLTPRILRACATVAVFCFVQQWLSILESLHNGKWKEGQYAQHLHNIAVIVSIYITRPGQS